MCSVLASIGWARLAGMSYEEQTGNFLIFDRVSQELSLFLAPFSKILARMPDLARLICLILPPGLACGFKLRTPPRLRLRIYKQSPHVRKGMRGGPSHR